IVDLLGAGEKIPQHHGAPGSDGPKVGRGGPGLGTGMLRRGPDYCGERGAGSGEQKQTAGWVLLPAPRSLLPLPHVLFLSLMLPFTVSRSSRRPPLPIVPWRLRGPSRPVTMSGKSVTMSPFTVLAFTSAVRSASVRTNVVRSHAHAATHLERDPSRRCTSSCYLFRGDGKHSQSARICRRRADANFIPDVRRENPPGQNSE